MEYFDELTRFLAQCRTENLKTAHYSKKLDGLKIKISFGKGNPARVPWIAFLAPGQHIGNGIYPFYLYYKTQDLLVLAFGISETLPPPVPWQLADAQTIDAYFKRKGLGKAARYGGSMVFKTYSAGELDRRQVDADLEEILTIYRATLTDGAPSEALPRPDFLAFHRAALEYGLQISRDMVIRFIAALIAKPFVILTGLSGAGKTRLAMAFAKWICESDNQVCLVPVGADWTNREPLLGFPNALEPGQYVKPESGVVDLLIAATADPDKPYFLILDEMNLSHVERYFADFLSGMESGEDIRLHAGESAVVPARMRIPRNCFIIGTVNIDETTYMFSPKVLDRANVIEFSISLDDMRNYLRSGKAEGSELAYGGISEAGIFVEMARNQAWDGADYQSVGEELLAFFEILKPAGAEFGYRSAAEILRFAGVVHRMGCRWTLENVIDAVLMQKVLPKIYGSRRKLEPVLKAMGRRCLTDSGLLEDYLLNKRGIAESSTVRYPMALDKIGRIYRNLIDHGFASYAEA